MTIDFGRSRVRICSSKETILPPISTPGRERTTEPVAMMQLSNVTVLPAALPSVICMVWASVKEPKPSISVILFFFIKKCTPLTIPEETLRERSCAAPKSKETSPEMPKVLASWLKVCASSAFLSNALEGMHPTFKHTPPQYCFSTTATFSPSWAARIAET